MRFRVYDKLKKKYVGESICDDVYVIAVDGKLYKNDRETWLTTLCDADWFMVEMSTGKLDKKGRELYAGDKVAFYAFARFTQQSFSELPPEIDEMVLRKYEDEVIFLNGGFVLKNVKIEDGIYYSFDCGFSDLEWVKDVIFGEDRKKQYNEEEMICDCNGKEIDESILSFEIIGNTHDEAKND